MQIPLNNLRRQHEVIAHEIRQAIDDVVDRCAFISGPEVKLFEQEFAAFSKVRHAIGVSNGTEAISLGLKAMGIGHGDQVVTVANTFIATISAITSIGAQPLLVDVEPETMLMDLDSLEACLDQHKASGRLKAIIPVHLYGQMVDMRCLKDIADRYGLMILEDSAQAHGANRDGIVPGELSACATFSFYPGKNLGAFGDAGAIVTQDERIAAKCAQLRDHGRREKYVSDILGTNARLDTLQAAVLRVKLRYLHDWTEKRVWVADRYDQRFAGSQIKPLQRVDGKHVFHLYVVVVDGRDEMLAKLKSEGIGAGVHYPVPIHQQPALSRLYQENFPVADAFSGRILSLPMDPFLGEKEIKFVADTMLAQIQG